MTRFVRSPSHRAESTDNGIQAGDLHRAGVVVGPQALPGSVELFDDNNVSVGTFGSIQAAIDAAGEGYRVVVGAGTYAEKLTVDVNGLTIEGLPGAILQGSFLTDNAIAGPLNEWLKTAAGYTGAAGVGITVTADDVTIEGLTVTAFLQGVLLGNGSDGTTLDGVTLISNFTGIHKPGSAAVTDFTMLGGSIEDGHLGMDIVRDPGSGGIFDTVLIDGTSFADLNRKGIYVEALSNAVITGFTMTNVGEFGGITATGALGAGGNGINLNLKYGTYTNILIEDFTMNDVGSSDRDGAVAEGHQNGGAIVVAARDDAPSYSGNPATVTNVTIRDGAIDGTSTGIQLGEPGKQNLTPDVLVQDVTIVDAQHTLRHGEVGNQSGAVMTFEGTSGADSLIVSGNSDGAFVVNAGGGADSVTTGSANDTITGGAGNDSINGGSGIDTAVVGSGATFIAGGANWTVTSSDGTDTLVNIEIVDAGPGSNTLLVGAGGFATIQAAINAAADGDTILVASGTYQEQLTIDGKTGLTIRAADGADVTVLSPAILAVNGTSDYYGIPVRAVIAVTDSTDVHIEGIAVDGNFSGDTTPGSNGDELSGIAFLNSSGGIDNVEIDDTGNSPGGGLFGLQHGSGLFIDNSGLTSGNDVTVTDSTITDFQKTGAIIIGAVIVFTGNTITGIGATGLTAQNGIQITLSEGTLNGNTISGIGYIVPIGGTYYYSSGIIAYEPSGALSFDGNTITGVGAAGEFTALDLSDTEGVAVGFTNNVIVNATNGIVAYTYVGGATGLDTQPDFTGTTFAGITGNGIYFDPEESYGAPFSTTTDFSITGSGFADVLAGSAGDDVFAGGGGADLLTGREGDDTLGGGADTDTAVYAGDRADYTIVQQVDPDGRVTGFLAVTDDNAGDGDEGADMLTSVEILAFDDVTLDTGQPVQLFDGANLVGTFATIQAAVDASADGNTIRVAAGTYTENVNFHTAVTVLGAHEGDAGNTRNGATAAGETTLIGRHDITATTGAVVLDGLRFVNTAATTNGGPSDPILQITSGQDHVVTNSVFYSEVAGGARPSPDDRAISMPVLADGTITISDNYFTGASVGGFSTASWGRAVWFDGGGADLVVTGNTFEYARTGLNLDMSGDSTVAVTGNLFTTTGTAMAVGVDMVGLTVTDNDFSNAGEEFNFRNQTGNVIFDAETAVDDQSGPFIDVLGGSGNDQLSGTSFNDLLDGNQLTPANADNDVLDGRGGNDLLLGRAGDDTLIGGLDNDSLDGGAGLDTAQFGGLLTFADTFVGWIVTSSEGTDILQNVEVAVDGNGQRNQLVGGTGHATLQAALNAAVTGDNVRLASGIYTGTVNYDDNGLTVIAQNGATQNLTYATAGTFGISVVAANGNDTIQTGAGADSILGGGGTDTLRGAGGNDFLDGGGGNDMLFGQADNDTLVGGTGNDTMSGGAGDDLYHVDNAGDLILENSGEGTDIGYASVGYTLNAGAHLELLATASIASTFAIDMTGNELDNTIWGNNGANTLSGGIGGNDTLVGFLGNDIYLVNNITETIVENAGEGTDIVYVNSNYTLSANASIELLSTFSIAGTDPINLTGNNLDNTIWGNRGDNVLSGGIGGNDTLVGFLGNDVYLVNNGNEVISELDGEGTDIAYAAVSYTLSAGASVELLSTNSIGGTGAINLTGNELANTLWGNNGANVLNGGLGADTLVGFGGADSFAFTAALGAANVDNIVDFSVVDDTIALDDAIFAGIGTPGSFNAAAFVTGAAAADADDRIVYNAATGQLFYDADGSGGGAAVLFATLGGNPALTASDFQVI